MKRSNMIQCADFYIYIPQFKPSISRSAHSSCARGEACVAAARMRRADERRAAASRASVSAARSTARCVRPPHFARARRARSSFDTFGRLQRCTAARATIGCVERAPGEQHAARRLAWVRAPGESHVVSVRADEVLSAAWLLYPKPFGQSHRAARACVFAQKEPHAVRLGYAPRVISQVTPGVRAVFGARGGHNDAERESPPMIEIGKNPTSL